MKTIIIIGILFLTGFLYWSWNNIPIDRSDVVHTQQSTPKELFDQKCMICHSTEGKTAKTMLAPPFYQVKKRYKMASMNKQDFIVTMTYWVQNPKKEDALLKGAVQELGVMPKLAYKEDEIKSIVAYIYEHDMPKPEWFDAHQAAHKHGHKH